MNLRQRIEGNRQTLSKVPEITAFFWIVKALTTAMGESTSDFLVHSLVPEIAVVLGGIAFCVAFYLQFVKDRYVPWAYWLAVAMVGVFGTMAADVLHVGLGVPYIASTIFYGVVLALVFRTWYRVEGTLSIHSITTPRRELFYWAAVLATFALGTAAGDLTAVTLGIGYFGGSSRIGLSERMLLVRLCRHPAPRRLRRRLARRLPRPRGARTRHRSGQPRSRRCDRRFRLPPLEDRQGHAT